MSSYETDIILVTTKMTLTQVSPCDLFHNLTLLEEFF